jgi:hypothetical protein
MADLIELAHRLHYAAYSFGFEAGKSGKVPDTTIAGNKAAAALNDLLRAIASSSSACVTHPAATTASTPGSAVLPTSFALTEEEREHIHAAIDMLGDYEATARENGNNSLEMGASATRHVLQKLFRFLPTRIAVPASGGSAVVPAGEERPVAVVGSDFTLLWASGDAISDIVKRHGLRVGSKLYAHSSGAKGDSDGR